jgi:hypothetical protein
VDAQKKHNAALRKELETILSVPTNDAAPPVAAKK